jgi:hypothetical protein
MTSRLGAQIVKGDKFKDSGRWHVAAADAAPFITGGQPYEPLRSVTTTATDDRGRPVTVGVLADEAYQLAGSGIPVRAYTHGRTSGPDPVTEIRFAKRDLGGWHVVLASNGRLLGWVVPARHGPGGWEARIHAEAFRGTGPGDTGSTMDDVPDDLFAGTGPASCRAVGYEKDRADAAQVIVQWLYDHSAPAAGFGPHYRVKAYVTPWCPGGDQRWAGDREDGPACPVCGLGPAALFADRPVRSHGRWAGKVPWHLKRERQS